MQTQLAPEFKNTLLGQEAKPNCTLTVASRAATAKAHAPRAFNMDTWLTWAARWSTPKFSDP